VLNETCNELKLEKHPDETSMGRIEKGFDFLGYRGSLKGLCFAEKAIDNFDALWLLSCPSRQKS
jgi:hypothetical protein